MEAVEKRVIHLCNYLADGLRSRGYRVSTVRECPEERSGILIFRQAQPEAARRRPKLNPRDNDVTRSKGLDRRGEDPWHLGLLDELLAEGIVISMRENALRVSPHFYNTEREIDELLEALP